MEKIILVFIIFLGVCSVESQRKDEPPKVEIKDGKPMRDAPREAAIEKILGKDVVVLIDKARRINIFRVKEFITDPKSRAQDKKYFADYEILGSIKLNKEKTRELRRILLTGDNYSSLDEVNKCEFAATIGIEIVHKKSRRDILISYPCNKILILGNGQEVYRDLKSVPPAAAIFDEFLIPLNSDKILKN